MNRLSVFTLFALLILLQSCEFSCSVGNKDTAKETTVFKDGVRVSNEIELQAEGVKVEKAYLVLADGNPVPDGNIVDFSQPVRLVVVIDKGWKEENNKVLLGASERIEAESGEVLLNEKDLFENKFEDGMPADDAKIIALTASIRLTKEVRPLTTFYVHYRIWDKMGKGVIQGKYKLYSK